MTTSQPALPETDRPARGIAWMLVTIFWFITLDALAKQALQVLPTVEVVWARFMFHMLLVGAVTGFTVPNVMRSGHIKLQLLRSGLLLTTTTLFFLGLRTTPLATTATIMFLAPIIVTALSATMLGEPVGPRRWAGVLIGFAGAVIVTRPGIGGMMPDPGMLLILAAAFTNALYQLTTRKLRIYDDPMTTLFYTAVAGAVLVSFAVPSVWQTPTAMQWLMLVAIGLSGAIGHLCLIRAFHAAPAATVVPFSYSSLLWASAYGFVLFSELPDRWTLTGAALIISSGLYIFHRERQKAAAAASAA